MVAKTPIEGKSVVVLRPARSGSLWKYPVSCCTYLVCFFSIRYILVVEKKLVLEVICCLVFRFQIIGDETALPPARPATSIFVYFPFLLFCPPLLILLPLTQSYLRPGLTSEVLPYVLVAPPPPRYVGALHSDLEKSAALSSIVDSRWVVLTHATIGALGSSCHQSADQRMEKLQFRE